MMSTRIVGLGAGGNAKVLIEILRAQKTYDLAGLLDPAPELHGSNVLGVPVLGGDNLLPGLIRDGVEYFFVGLGGVGDNNPRRRLFEMALSYGLKPVSIIHPQAIISPSAEIGKGVMIMAGAVVNACARLGENVLVNTGAVIEHECIIGDHVHIATSAQLAGGVSVDDMAHIGIGAVVLQGVYIGKKAIVGAGAVVVKDVQSYTVVVGVPAQTIKKLNSES